MKKFQAIFRRRRNRTEDVSDNLKLQDEPIGTANQIIVPSQPSQRPTNQTTQTHSSHKDSQSAPLFPDGIEVLENCPDAIVDICFVHGLAGNRIKTWTADGETTPWIKTLLPPRLPKARILAFGYDAYFMNKRELSSNRLIDHATNLLNDLTNDRTYDNASSRPLIFVAHSLGGLVCKEAILLSRNHPETHLRDIFNYLHGIIFMGTPHTGSWMADWAKIPVRSLGLFKSTNASLLAILETDNQLLESIQIKFRSMIRELQKEGRTVEVTCFFEELPTSDIGAKVVSKNSAVLEELPSFSIRANHRDMVKFRSEDETGFKRLLGELARWVKYLSEWNGFTSSNRNKITNFMALGGPRDTTKGSDMCILVDKPSTERNCIDIVALHGLNGDFEKTWTWEYGDGKVNWLKHIIPAIAPSARIMAFRYDSDIFFSKSSTKELPFGKHLLESLSSMRQSEEEKYRQVVFLCHSMGGVVFKHAIVWANRRRRFKQLVQEFHAVLFFGTPHRESSESNWHEILSRMLKEADFDPSTYTALSKYLMPQCLTLQEISESFFKMIGSLKIASFCETEIVDVLKAKVLEDDSAVLGLEHESVLRLYGNHRTICQFSDLHELRFQPVLALLKEITSTAVKKTTEKRIKAIFQILAESPYKSHKNRTPDPIDGTCTWVLKHSKYENWIHSPQPALLWLSADPGCGKSVLASFLIDHLNEDGLKTGVNLCYYFFKADDSEQWDATIAMQSLLYQTCTEHKNLQTIVATELSNADLQNLDRLWQMFEKTIERSVSSSTVCILDGLDECEPKSRKRLLLLISKYFARKACQDETTISEQSGNAGLKLLVTSRPDNSIKVIFDHLARKTKQPQDSGPKSTGTEASIPKDNEALAQPGCCSVIRLRGEDETTAISQDIIRVVKNSISELIEQGLPEELLADVQKELITRADRTFLWITLILHLLKEKVEEGASRRELDEILQSREIDAVYTKLLAAQVDSPKAKKLLCIVLAARNPLTTAQLSTALAVDPEPPSTSLASSSYGPLQTFDDVEKDLAYPFENRIKSLCGHFIRIIRDRIYLVHETAREFLLEQYRDNTNVEPDTASESSVHTCEPNAWQHSLSRVACETLLLNICVTYIYLLARKCNTASMGNPSPNTRDFLIYAAKSWVVHFHQVPMSKSSQGYYHDLCHPRFPGFKTWIKEFWNPTDVPHAFTSSERSEDLQDRYIRFFQLDKFDVEMEEPENIFSENNENAEQLFLQASLVNSEFSNPESLPNSYFPLRANSAGRLSVCYPDIKDIKKRQGNRMRNNQATN